MSRDSSPRVPPRPDPDAGGPERPLSALDRAIMQAMGEGRALGHPDDPARQRYPTVWDWLTRVYIGREHLRSPSTVSVRATPTGMSISISDRDLSISCGVAVMSLEDVWRELEAALTCPVPPIVSWGKGEPKVRKRRNG